MIELSGIQLKLHKLDGSAAAERRALLKAIRRMLRLPKSEPATLTLAKRSIDARKKNDVHLSCTARFELHGKEAAEKALLAQARRWRVGKQLRQIELHEPNLPHATLLAPISQPIVVGAGCAGLFCALALAEAGLQPLLVERGDGSHRRSAAIELFNTSGELDPESNIQFGLGGAGAFSDGKLGTGTKSALHRLILQTLVQAGAPKEILWDAKPHVGSDVLPAVVEHILQRIQAAGGEVRLRTRMSDLSLKDGRITSVTLSSRDEKTGILREERIGCSQLVLACGHSARDVFTLLRERGVHLERKTFAMGVRIEHLQAAINRAQYGAFAEHPALGAAPYKLAAHLPNGRSAFSFCMCPGGYVVAAASEKGGVVTNGMSLSDRAGTNANAGFLANVQPEDLPGSDVLAGISLQRQCEEAAYQAGGGAYVAPAQLLGDFLQGTPSSGQGSVSPTYPRGVSWGTLDGLLPEYILETLRAAVAPMERKLHGFAAKDAVLTGVETRSSSPVRVSRGTDGQSITCQGLFPCGEGAGYAGGIMSAATDGLRCAQWVMDALDS